VVGSPSRGAPHAVVAQQGGLGPQGTRAGMEASESLVPSVQVRFSPMVALFLHSQSQTITWPLPSGQPCSLADLLRQVEQQAPEVLLQANSTKLRPHIRVSVNGRAGASPEQQISAGDVVEIAVRLVEGG